MEAGKALMSFKDRLLAQAAAIAQADAVFVFDDAPDRVMEGSADAGGTVPDTDSSWCRATVWNKATTHTPQLNFARRSLLCGITIPIQFASLRPPVCAVIRRRGALTSKQRRCGADNNDSVSSGRACRREHTATSRRCRCRRFCFGLLHTFRAPLPQRNAREAPAAGRTPNDSLGGDPQPEGCAADARDDPAESRRPQPGALNAPSTSRPGLPPRGDRPPAIDPPVADRRFSLSTRTTLRERRWAARPSRLRSWSPSGKLGEQSRPVSLLKGVRALHLMSQPDAPSPLRRRAAAVARAVSAELEAFQTALTESVRRRRRPPPGPGFPALCLLASCGSHTDRHSLIARRRCTSKSLSELSRVRSCSSLLLHLQQREDTQAAGASLLDQRRQRRAEPCQAPARAPADARAKLQPRSTRPRRGGGRRSRRQRCR